MSGDVKGEYKLGTYRIKNFSEFFPAFVPQCGEVDDRVGKVGNLHDAAQSMRSPSSLLLCCCAIHKKKQDI